MSGGDRTRLAVARMHLRTSNTLHLEEPTNHLELDSKDVLLDALADYGGTLVIVSHDRYFVEKLATKIIEIGHGEANVYPGTYTEFLWHKSSAHTSTPNSQTTKSPSSGAKLKAPATQPGARGADKTADKGRKPDVQNAKTDDREARKRQETDRRKVQKAANALQKRIAELEARIADREAQVKDLESTMSAPGFYDDREGSKLVIDRHQALMWEVGDLMAQWEALQEHARASES
jgi:ATP-binding cassette subfamily F protein 3